MTKLWFKAKRYGWGWYPATWEGWAVIIAYMGIMFVIMKNAESASTSVKDIFSNIIVESVILTIVLIWICYKTGEKPRWRWGD